MGGKFNSKIHHRKSIRLKEYDYAEGGWYYITNCSKNRANIFGRIEKNKMIKNDFGNIVEEEWLRVKQLRKNVDLDYYVVMPNYFHGIVIIESRDKASLVPTDVRKFGKPVPGSLSTIIGSYKSAVTKRINEKRQEKTLSIWQRNFYEHIIRNEQDLFFIRRYIELNIFKWELDDIIKISLKTLMIFRFQTFLHILLYVSDYV